MFNLRTEFVFVLHIFKYYGFNKINTIYYWPAYTQVGQTSNGRWRFVICRLSSSVTLAHMQRNSPGAARDGGPVVLLPERHLAIVYFNINNFTVYVGGKESNKVINLVENANFCKKTIQFTKVAYTGWLENCL